MHLTNVIYSNKIASNFEAVLPVLDDALAAMREHGCLDPAKESPMRLCLEEALVNAVRHGNACDGSREILVEILGETDRCVIKVCDEGCGFSPEQVELPPADKPGGRGICLIRHFMDEVRFDAEEKCFVMELKRATA